MRQYTSPRTDVVSVQSVTTLLAASGMPIGGGDEQVKAW
jgi:hypothetical protein